MVAFVGGGFHKKSDNPSACVGVFSLGRLAAPGSLRGILNTEAQRHREEAMGLE